MFFDYRLKAVFGVCIYLLASITGYGGAIYCVLYLQDYTMDIKTAKTLRKYLKAVGTHLKEFRYRASNDQLLTICENVKLSDKGIHTRCILLYIYALY